MKRIILVYLLSALLGACVTIDKKESFLFEQISFEEQISKGEVKSDDYSDSPKRVDRQVSVRRDSLIQIIYTTKRTSKRDKQGVYTLEINSSDTTEIDPSLKHFVPSEVTIDGSFIRPKTDFPMIESSKKLIFNMDGTCIESSVRNCSDSPCSTLHERIGDYRMINDTLHVTFYLGRSWFSGHSHLIQLKDVQWHVTQPISYQYMLSSKLDSLMIYNDHSRTMDLFLVAGDTIRVTPNGID